MESYTFTIRVNSGTLLAVYLLLVLAGFLYNQAIARAEREGWLEGFTWLAVVIGVAFTLGFLALINLMVALIALGGFVASGISMAGGAIWRYIKARKAGVRHEQQAARLAEQREIRARQERGEGVGSDPTAEAAAVQGTRFHRD